MFSIQTRRAPRVGEHYSCRLRYNHREVEIGTRVRSCVLKGTTRQENGDFAPNFQVGLEVDPEDTAKLAGVREALGMPRKSGS